MSRGYLMRCHNRECEVRTRMSAATLKGWPEHCGQPMVFATTFDEERFHRKQTPAKRPTAQRN